ncbi:molybdenum cofactor guanylyltransferase [Deinococcus altitudinis]|uniref:molybdenum cofactor guanylyltransferase n=1 Tax=Deinococcus altitudinis TaxID=468914 RepID=UPI00389184F1
MKTDELPGLPHSDTIHDTDAGDHTVVGAAGVGLAAAITAGGRSRRFGQDKALYAVQGVPLLNRVAGSLQAFSPRLLIAPEGRYILAGWAQHADLRPGEGPLAGLETALSVLAAHGSVHDSAPLWLAFAAVDLPNLTARYWHLLADRAGPGARPTVRAVLGLDARQRPQPLAGLYHVSLLPLVTALLGAGERRMLALTEHLTSEQGAAGEARPGQGPGCEFVPWEVVEAVCPEAYVNLNTPPE